MAWSKDELQKIAEADDLHISAFREDGVTSGTLTWIWSVAVNDSLYVRAYNGQAGVCPGGRERGRIFAKTRRKDFSPRLEMTVRPVCTEGGHS